MQIFLALIPIIYNHLLYFIVCPLSQITILLMFFPTSSYPSFLSSPDFPYPHCYSSIQPYNLHTIQNEHPYVLHLPHTRACFLDPNHTFPSALQFSTRFCIQYDLSADKHFPPGIRRFLSYYFAYRIAYGSCPSQDRFRPAVLSLNASMTSQSPSSFLSQLTDKASPLPSQCALGENLPP